MVRVVAVHLLAQGGVFRLERAAFALGRLGRGFGFDILVCEVDGRQRERAVDAKDAEPPQEAMVCCASSATSFIYSTDSSASMV